jgi:hypothetical protein
VALRAWTDRESNRRESIAVSRRSRVDRRGSTAVGRSPRFDCREWPSPWALRALVGASTRRGGDRHSGSGERTHCDIACSSRFANSAGRTPCAPGTATAASARHVAHDVAAGIAWIGSAAVAPVWNRCRLTSLGYGRGRWAVGGVPNSGCVGCLGYGGCPEPSLTDGTAGRSRWTDGNHRAESRDERNHGAESRDGRDRATDGIARRTEPRSGIARRTGSRDGRDRATDGIARRTGSRDGRDRATDGIARRTGSRDGRDRGTDGTGGRTGLGADGTVMTDEVGGGRDRGLDRRHVTALGYGRCRPTTGVCLHRRVTGCHRVVPDRVERVGGCPETRGTVRPHLKSTRRPGSAVAC